MKFELTIGTVLSMIIIALLILITYKSCTKIMEHTYEHMTSPKIKWSRNKCNYYMGETLFDVLRNFKIQRDDTNWGLYMPCAYDDIAGEHDAMPIKDGALYYIIDGVDTMTAKDWLWKNCVAHHGLAKSITMMPMSYILYDTDDINRFKKEYNSNKIYIMKKNVQRQTGLLITNKDDDIIDGYKNGYVIAQELLQDPYEIRGRKINLRFYVLVTCKQGKINVYVYNNGFMYYTKELFKKNSTHSDHNITTGYIDRWVYDINPLTHDEFRTYLDSPNVKDRNMTTQEKNIMGQKIKISDVVFDRINKLLAEVFITFIGKICQSTLTYNNMKFQLFGIDISINDELQPMIMEINKGPDMGGKDKKDYTVKYNATTDVLRIANVITDDMVNNRPNGFVNILSI